MSERLGDVQRGGVWPPEKFSQIGSNVPFKHRQTQVFVFPPLFSYQPTSHRRFGSVFEKGMFYFYPLPPHTPPAVFSYLDIDRRDDRALSKFQFNSPR